MKHYLHFFLIWIFQIGLTQIPLPFQNGFTETTSEQEKFSMYLDSIDKYLYRDVQTTAFAITACEKIIQQKTPLADSVLFDFVLNKVYHQHSLAEPVHAYQIIVEHDFLLDSLDITAVQKGSFRYLKGFTLMSLGDLAAAQKTFYENLSIAEAQKDTSTVISCLYSIGQLYHDEGKYEASIQQFQKILSLGQFITIRPSTAALLNMELSESYYSLGKMELALEHLNQGLTVSEKNDLQVLKSDILINKGKLLLKTGKLKEAEQIHVQLQQLSARGIDQNIIQNTQSFLALLYKSKKQFHSSLTVYKNIIADLDTTQVDKLIDAYEMAYQVSEAMKDYDLAYQYLLQYNLYKEKREQDSRKQQTDYLAIKFESAQKEQENAMLSIQVVQAKTEKKVLYLGIALSLLTLSVLFWAFIQKKKYSERLEVEVLHRTTSLNRSNKLLKKSNRELHNFNRILSHDLKEPLRNIISFSQLLKREVTNSQKADEYLKFIISGGNQLKQIIESVHLFQSANLISASETKNIDIGKLLETTIIKVKENHPDKSIDISINQPDLHIQSSPYVLKSVFNIILDNALRYNHHDVVKIQLHYTHAGGKHLLQFIDNGIGIDEKFYHQIFDMFTRLNNRKDFQGTGMGLSIAKKLLEKIGGQISVLQSEINKGSTFLISIPITG